HRIDLLCRSRHRHASMKRADHPAGQSCASYGSEQISKDLIEQSACLGFGCPISPVRQLLQTCPIDQRNDAAMHADESLPFEKIEGDRDAGGRMPSIVARKSWDWSLSARSCASNGQ